MLYLVKEGEFCSYKTLPAEKKSELSKTTGVYQEKRVKQRDKEANLKHHLYFVENVQEKRNGAKHVDVCIHAQHDPFGF